MGWKDILMLAGVFVAWVALSRWILPQCGVPTCCCPEPPRPKVVQPLVQPGGEGDRQLFAPNTPRPATGTENEPVSDLSQLPSIEKETLP